MTFSRTVVALVSLFCLAAGLSPAVAGTRLALVLGNSKYEAVPARRYVVYRRIRLIGGCNWIWC